MPRARVLLLTALALLAFAGNSLLCRIALRATRIDPATFTSVRLISGALALWLIVRWREPARGTAGSWRSALALFAYAICFSYAYVGLSAGAGALLLFGAVQATMLGYGFWNGERLHALQACGLAMALAGLTGLLVPGLTAPPPLASALMLGAGVAWGVYSLRGRRSGAALPSTAHNFLRTLPMTAAASLVAASFAPFSPDVAGVACALASGIVTSALGYAAWYAALKGLSATQAATVQLSVPIIAAVAGIALLGEPFTLRLALAALAILGGIALVIGAAARGSAR